MSHIHFFGEAGGMSFAKTLPDNFQKKGASRTGEERKYSQTASFLAGLFVYAGDTLSRPILNAKSESTFAGRESMLPQGE
jgi:hypothetical protein